MGSELWTSPLAGYRRRGTRLAELREHFEGGITAAAILEPLRSCLETQPAEPMAAVLAERDFDIAGVKASPLGPVCGYVKQATLLNGGEVRDHVLTLTPEVLIADSTPLAEIFAVLAERPFMFVMLGSEVRGIVTQADLNKPPVRIYLFGILSLVEMHLSFWIRSQLGEDDWQSLLHPRRLRSAEALLERKRANGHDTSLLDCLTLGDKKVVAMKSPGLLERLGIAEADSDRLDDVHALRNQLAHSYEDLAQGHTWGEIQSVVEWVEALVHHSDEEIEAEASARAGDYEDGLWASV